jgi:hypothetical protein
MRKKLLLLLIFLRLITNDGMMLQNRSPKPKLQPPEILRFIRRPAKKGRKLFFR